MRILRFAVVKMVSVWLPGIGEREEGIIVKCDCVMLVKIGMYHLKKKLRFVDSFERFDEYLSGLRLHKKSHLRE